MTGSQEIILSDAAVDYDPLRLRETEAGSEITRRSFLDTEFNINLVSGICHRWRFDINPIEVTQSLQPDPRTFNRAGRDPTGFELTHLAPENHIASLGVAAEVDSSYINPLSRIDRKR